MKNQEIKVLVSGAVHEVISRPVIKGSVCYRGKWFVVTDGAIDFTKEAEVQSARQIQYVRDRMDGTILSRQMAVAGLAMPYEVPPVLPTRGLSNPFGAAALAAITSMNMLASE